MFRSGITHIVLSSPLLYLQEARVNSFMLAQPRSQTLCSSKNNSLSPICCMPSIVDTIMTVVESHFRYIAASQIPVQYGGLKRETDSEFSVDDDAQEAIVKAGSQETIEIPTPEVPLTFLSLQTIYHLFNTVVI